MTRYAELAAALAICLVGIALRMILSQKRLLRRSPVMNSAARIEAPRPVLGRWALLGPDACVGLWLVCLLSLVPHLLWLGLGPKAIEVEGSLYARVGEGIAMGRGLLDVPCIEGVFLVHPPLYPALIAGGIRLGLGSETAQAHRLWLLFGIPLPVVICLICRRLYGPAAGWLGGCGRRRPSAPNCAVGCRAERARQLDIEPRARGVFLPSEFWTSVLP